MQITRSVLSSLSLTVLSLAQTGPSAALSSSRLVDEATYQRILDRVFPHPDVRSDVYQYSIVLRFLPSSRPEIQLAIRVTNAGKPEISISQVSGRSAWNTANDYINQARREDEVEISKMINVNTRALTLSAELAEKWHSKLLNSVAESANQLEKDTIQFRSTHEVTVVLEGTTYQLSMDQGMATLHWESIDEEVSSSQITGRFAATRVMNEVLKSAETYVTSSDKDGQSNTSALVVSTVS